MDLEKKLEQIKPYQLNCNVFSVYDYPDTYSMQELLNKFFDTINNCVELCNNVLDLAKWLVSVGLEQEVAKKLDIWLQDGTLANIINEKLFGELNSKIDKNITDLESANLKITDNTNKINDNTNKFNLLNKKFNSVVQINLFDFGYNGEGYINESIENAMQGKKNNSTRYEIVLPCGDLKINRPITLPRNFTITGNNTTIIADFPNWTSSEFDCVQFKIDTTAPTPNDVIQNFNKRFENITLDSIGSTQRPNTTGLKIFSSGLTGASVNRALNNARFKNVLIRNFEYGLVINECFGSTFVGIDIIQTRVGILIEGQSVNLSFTGMNISNHVRDYTTNNTTYSLMIKANSKNEKPEGLMFANCLFFGSDYGIDLRNGYFATFTNCIIDWCIKACVRESNFRNYTISDSYLAVYGQDSTPVACIQSNHVFDASSPLTSDPCSAKISNCSFFGGTNRSVSAGIDFGVDYNYIVGFSMNIQNCDFDSFNNIVRSTKIAPAQFTMENIRGLNIDSTVIKVEGGLWDSFFNEITVASDAPFIDLRPAFISKSVRFGRNVTNTTKTYNEGGIDIQQGQQSVLIDNKLYNEELGLNTVTTILNPYSLPPFKIQENAQWSKANIVFDSPVDKNYHIRWSARVVKSSL